MSVATRLHHHLSSRAIVSLALSFAAAGCAASRSFDLEAAPPDVQAAYEVFAYRCSKCHSLSRPLNARVWTEEHWDLYVNRMRRMPTSGINPEDAEVILRFLHYYAKRRVSGDEALEVEEKDTRSSPQQVPP